MLAGQQIRGLVNPACPIDWSHPLNSRVTCEFSVLPNPGWSGSQYWCDLKKPSLRFSLTGGSRVVTNIPGPRWNYGGVKLDSSSYGVLPATGLGNLGDGRTVACWVYVPGGSGNGGFVWSILNASSQSQGIYLEVSNLTVNLAQPGGNRVWTGSVPSAGWYHIVATVKGDAGPYDNGLWINGVSQTYVDFWDRRSGAATSFEIGRFGSTYTPLWVGTGYIDQLQVFPFYCGPDTGSGTPFAVRLYQEAKAGNPNRWNWIRGLWFSSSAQAVVAVPAGWESNSPDRLRAALMVGSRYGFEDHPLDQPPSPPPYMPVDWTFHQSIGQRRIRQDDSSFELLTPAAPRASGWESLYPPKLPKGPTDAGTTERTLFAPPAATAASPTGWEPLYPWILPREATDAGASEHPLNQPPAAIAANPLGWGPLAPFGMRRAPTDVGLAVVIITPIPGASSLQFPLGFEPLFPWKLPRPGMPGGAWFEEHPLDQPPPPPPPPVSPTGWEAFSPSILRRPLAQDGYYQPVYTLPVYSWGWPCEAPTASATRPRIAGDVVPALTPALSIASGWEIGESPRFAPRRGTVSDQALVYVAPALEAAPAWGWQSQDAAMRRRMWLDAGSTYTVVVPVVLLGGGTPIFRSGILRGRIVGRGFVV